MKAALPLIAALLMTGAAVGDRGFGLAHQTAVGPTGRSFVPFFPIPAHYWPSTAIVSNEVADTGSVGGSPLVVTGTGLTVVNTAVGPAFRFSAVAAAQLSSATSIAGMGGTPTATGWFFIDEPALEGALIQLAEFSSHIYEYNTSGAGVFDIGFFNSDPSFATGPTGQWVLIGLRISAGFTQVSVNGGSWANVSGGGDPSSEPLVFASESFGLPRLRSASLRNPAFWTVLLSTAEIAELYRRGPAVPIR